MIGASCARGSFTSATQNGTNARHELARIEGFGEIIVCADFEPKDAVDSFTAGGEQKDRNGRLMAQRFEQFESGAAGQHHIENDELVVVGESGGQTGVMIVGGIDVKSFGLEKAAKEVDERVVVVDDEELVHRSHFAFSGGRSEEH